MSLSHGVVAGELLHGLGVRTVGDRDGVAGTTDGAGLGGLGQLGAAGDLVPALGERRRELLVLAVHAGAFGLVGLGPLGLVAGEQHDVLGHGRVLSVSGGESDTQMTDEGGPNRQRATPRSRSRRPPVMSTWPARPRTLVQTGEMATNRRLLVGTGTVLGGAAVLGGALGIGARAMLRRQAAAARGLIGHPLGEDAPVADRVFKKSYGAGSSWSSSATPSPPAWAPSCRTRRWVPGSPRGSPSRRTDRCG